jgi:hypothetical protein
MGLYGLNSALTNTMCFDDGGALTNGQYLNGAIPPESCGILRRCFIDGRFIYAHIVLTHALHPRLGVRQADRIFVFDRQSGVILLSDAFVGDRPISFATHLHCSGTVTDLGEGQYRLTGGQANLIAGIKSGSKGLDDGEKGEIFVEVLESAPSTRVVVEEPTWVPAYIYGLNNTGREDFSEGRFPRYRRWRLEATEPVAESRFVLALSPERNQLRYSDGAVLLPGGAGIWLGSGTMRALGVECSCECLLWDEAARRITAIGLRSLSHGESKLSFASPVDVEYSTASGEGIAFAQGNRKPETIVGFSVAPWGPVGDDAWRTDSRHRASFKIAWDKFRKVENRA